MKKALVFNGSPRKRGDSAQMIAYLCQHLDAEVTVVNAYTDSIKPCVDCRWCFKNNGCVQKDEMQAVYEAIQECDYIILASPIYFEELTGMLLAVMSRFQTYFSARYMRGEEPITKKKTGGILLAAGSIGPREKAESTAQMLLRQLNCESKGTVYVAQTDRNPLSERSDWKEQIEALASQMQVERND